MGVKKLFKNILIIAFSFILVGCSEVDSLEISNKEVKASMDVDKSNSNHTVNEVNGDETDTKEEKKETDKKSDEKVSNKIGENDPIVNNKVKKEFKDIKIVIDPGHSSNPGSEKEKTSPNSKEKKLKDTVGATGTKSRKEEYKITHEIAIELEKALKSNGYTVFMTKRNFDEKMSNIERAQFGNKNNADLVLRLHCDSVDSQDAKGASALIPTVSGYVTNDISHKSKEYGKKIINEYTKGTNIKNRGIVYRDDLTGFNWSKVPVVLLEMGFLSNPNEDIYLSDKNNHNEIVKSITNGINSIFQ